MNYYYFKSHWISFLSQIILPNFQLFKNNANIVMHTKSLPTHTYTTIIYKNRTQIEKYVIVNGKPMKTQQLLAVIP